MDLKLSQIILYSYHKENVAQFFSGLFDMDILPVGEGIKLIHSDFHFVVIAADQTLPVKKLSAGLVLDFKVDTKDELIALHQKVQFLSYRYHFDFAPMDEGKLHQHGKISTFFLNDPDGRKWKFSCKE